MVKGRLWCFTNFNLDFDYEEYLAETTAEYVVVGREECPDTKKHHDQGFVYFSGARGSIKGVAKQLGKCHVECCQGNMDQNTDYCSKDDNVREFGVKPTQGKRTDLKKIYENIVAGEQTVDQLTVEQPEAYHQYGRTLNKLEDIALRRRFRTSMTKGIWLWGPTGVGKSHRAFENYSPETHYIYPNDGGWWDGYAGQKIIVFNEFRATETPYAELLDLMDKWPKTCRRRGREPVPFLAEKIIITSRLHPNEIYYEAEDPHIEQLKRRCEIVKISGTEVV